VDFYEIENEMTVSPGEYVLHKPTNAIVLCGAFNKEENFMRVFDSGRLVEDQIQNFKKIKVSPKERRRYKPSRCKGCGKK
tara:strand:+ start:1000 stop:1239 length:240 start_codon:yes stop_codon:yes gene_type:complete